MPQKYLELQEQQIVQRLRRNTLAAGFCTITGFTLLIPAFSVEGTKFDYQTFCFQPQIVYSTDHHYCTGSKIRRGIAWRVALESANNQEFKDKVTLLKLLPAQNPHAGLYGLGSAAFFSAAFLLFSQGTEQLEANLDLVVGNKKALIQERSLEQMKHLSIQTLKTQQEEGFIKEAMNRDHGTVLYDLMSEGEKRLAAEEANQAKQLTDADFELKKATLNAQTAEQLEQEIKHRIEVEKLRKSSDIKDSNQPQLEFMLKEHEDGWLWTLAKGKMPIIIYGKQGAYKSYTAASLALLKSHFQGAKLYSISDPHAHQNQDTAWKELIASEPDIYGSHENWEEYGESIDNAKERWSMRTLNDDPIISIWDELTTMGMEIPDKSIILMPKVISAPRKANENVICITHSLTNAGLGGVEGMSEAIKEGTIRLKLKANGFQQPLFKGELSGWTDNEGNDINDKPVTLPPWFRPDQLVQMIPMDASLKSGRGE
jgi:hypothetical protein